MRRWKYWETKYFRILVPADRENWKALLYDWSLSVLFYSWLLISVWGIYFVLSVR